MGGGIGGEGDFKPSAEIVLMISRQHTFYPVIFQCQRDRESLRNVAGAGRVG